MWSSARSEAALRAALPAPVDIRPVRGARRFRLRLDSGSGRLRLTCPPRTSRRTALAWALEQKDWIEAQLAAAEPAIPFVPGAIIPIEGRDTLIAWSPDAPREPVLNEGVLVCGGPAENVPARVERFLRKRALEIMSREVADYSAMAGETAAAVSVGAASSRWGSCSSSRRIRLNWRLILAEPEVRRYVVAHEVAHLVHLDHGLEFKALEARLFGPGLAEAKAALRRSGPRLLRFGRGR